MPNFYILGLGYQLPVLVHKQKRSANSLFRRQELVSRPSPGRGREKEGVQTDISITVQSSLMPRQYSLRSRMGATPPSSWLGRRLRAVVLTPVLSSTIASTTHP